MSFNRPGIYTWLRGQGFVKAKGTKPYTHLCMAGAVSGIGPIQLPPKSDEFFKQYADSWQKEQPIYLCQQGNDVCPLMLDADLEVVGDDVQSITNKDLERLFNFVQHVVCRSFSEEPKKNFMCYAGSTEATPKAKAGNGDGEEAPVWKIGVHMHWPGIYADAITRVALQIMLATSARTMDALGDLGKGRVCNDWEDVFDRDVATRGNLRMFGSRKMGFCSCKKEGYTKKKCNELGHFNGLLDLGRVYELERVYVIDDKCEVVQSEMDLIVGKSRDVRSTDEVKTAMVHLLVKCDITTSGVPSTVTIDPAILRLAKQKRKRGKVSGGDGKAINKRQEVQGRGGAAAEDLKKQVEAKKMLCVDFLRMYCPQYEPIMDSFKFLDKSPACAMFQLKNKFCLNKECDHSKAGQYIVISPTRVNVRCYSGKAATGLFDQPCQNFQTHADVPERFGHALFGQHSYQSAYAQCNGTSKVQSVREKLHAGLVQTANGGESLAQEQLLRLFKQNYVGIDTTSFDTAYQQLENTRIKKG